MTGKDAIIFICIAALTFTILSILTYVCDPFNATKHLKREEHKQFCEIGESLLELKKYMDAADLLKIPYSIDRTNIGSFELPIMGYRINVDIKEQDRSD